MIIATALALMSCSPDAPSWPLPQWEHGGVPVRIERQSRASLGATAAAQVRGGMGWIYWTDEIQDLPESVRVFCFAHEAAHIGGAVGELDADCQAARWMRRADYLPDRWLYEVADWLQGQSEDATHPPGSARAAMVMICGRE